MLPRELRDVPLEFETERLVLRAPLPGIGPALFEAINASMADLKQWMPWAHDGLTPETVEAEARQAYARFITREDLRFHIFLKGSDAVIGGTGLHRINWSVPRFETGYWIDSRHTGRGYAREAAAAMTDLALEGLGGRRVEIRCDSTNVRSIAIPRALGFQLDGELRNHFRAYDDDSQLRDILIFSKIR